MPLSRGVFLENYHFRHYQHLFTNSSGTHCSKKIESDGIRLDCGNLQVTCLSSLLNFTFPVKDHFQLFIFAYINDYGIKSLSLATINKFKQLPQGMELFQSTSWLINHLLDQIENLDPFRKYVPVLVPSIQYSTDSVPLLCLGGKTFITLL